jgi:hypothetical protein
MDDPDSQQEEPERHVITSSQVWEQLSPDVRTRVLNLLARLAYKWLLAEQESLSEGRGVKGEIQGDESQDHG